MRLPFCFASREEMREERQVDGIEQVNIRGLEGLIYTQQWSRKAHRPQLRCSFGLLGTLCDCSGCRNRLLRNKIHIDLSAASPRRM